ncbi:four-carbon acid sugar kinase family protein [Azospirillum sp. ST 5-10]|uniref:four-carbon acid sugar kinase family protein n=1 Tax=unclassified Azospirillum TaxID=2630922 RepID=UPI003F49EBB2
MTGPAGRGPEIVFVGDDFTGASDTLATLARAGRRTRLFLDPPDAAALAAEPLDAVGVATELRALDPEAIHRRVDTIAGAIAAVRPRFVHYKVCSTFDSGPQTGNIGAAVRALEARLGPALVAVVGGQPSLRRYCLFGHLFAAAADGTVHRIDRHPIMRTHPTTPMAESDLRLHLEAQGLAGLALVPWTEIGDDAASLAARLSGLLAGSGDGNGADNRAGKGAGGGSRLLVDVAETAQLATLGAALRRLETGGRPIVLVGASSVAESLTAGTGAGAGAPAVATAAAPAAGPCLVVAGSRSAVTAAQVAAATRFERVAVTPEAVADGAAAARLVAAVAAALGGGRNVLAHLVPERDYGVNALTLARRLADLAADIVAAAPVGALGVAGGDTSSVVVRRLGFASLAYRGTLDPGVAVCTGRTPGRGDVWLMLKGGQMGGGDLFDRFAAAWSGRS